MGMKIFNSLAKYMPVDPQGVFVEIGSDRYEGSTHILAGLAKNYGTKLISVDVLREAQDRLQHKLDNVEFVIESGSKWANEYAKLDIKIAVLYLDNFDYLYDTNDATTDPKIKKQIASYADRGIEMNNVNCQIEHMKQLVSLLPTFTPDTLIIFDDTYQMNGCWVGKCGPCVVYLLCLGYEVLEWTTDCGMIMKKSLTFDAKSYIINL
jgi:hypothetical protein